MVKSTAMYKGYTYIGGFDEIEEVNFSTDKVNSLDYKMKLLEAQLPYLAYQIEGVSDTTNITQKGVKSATLSTPELI